jgi:hypothetical protein
MKAIQITMVSVTGVLLLIASERTAAAGLFGSVGVGCGIPTLLSSGPQKSLAAAGTITYCETGPSFTLRVARATGLIQDFSSSEGYAIEVAILGGYDYFFRNSASLAGRMGFGVDFFHEDRQPHYYWDYWERRYRKQEKEHPRLALQFDAFYKRIGVSYMTHFIATDSFSIVLLCFRFGDISKRTSQRSGRVERMKI